MTCAAARNSAPSSRYSTASDPITAMSETALEMGWRCTTTLMAATTAIPAKTRKRIKSISRNSRKRSDHQAGGQQVQHGDREQNLPGEAHQLIVTEARQRAANPDKQEQNGAGLGAEPEQRQQRTLHDRHQEHRRDDEEDHAERRESETVASASRVQPAPDCDHSRDRENHNRHVAGAIRGRPRRHPSSQE